MDHVTNMSGKGGKRQAEDRRVRKAVNLVLQCDRVLSVLEAMSMCAACFTGKCAATKTKQMRVLRRLQKARAAKESRAARADALPLPITQTPDVLASQIVALSTIRGKVNSPLPELIARTPRGEASHLCGTFLPLNRFAKRHH